LWPQNDRGASYLLLAATNTTVILMFVQWVTLWSPQVIICSSVFIPIFGLFAAIVNRESSTKARSFPQYLLLSGSVALITSSASLRTLHADVANVPFYSVLGFLLGCLSLILAFRGLQFSRSYFRIMHAVAVTSLLWAIGGIPTFGSYIAAAK